MVLQVQNCVYLLLNFSIVYMNIIRGLDFFVNFYVMGKKNYMKNLKLVYRMVVKKIDQTGFDIVFSFYNSKYYLLFCFGYNNVYVRIRGIFKIFMSGFESKLVFFLIYKCFLCFCFYFIFNFFKSGILLYICK